MRYAMAVALLLSGASSVIAAIGVGLSALFHWLEAIYGSNIAYASTLGILILFGIGSTLGGMMLLKRPLRAVPNPRKQVNAAAARRAVASEAMLAVPAPHEALPTADPITETMVGLAASCLVAWLFIIAARAMKAPSASRNGHLA